MVRAWRVANWAHAIRFRALAEPFHPSRGPIQAHIRARGMTFQRHPVHGTFQQIDTFNVSDTLSPQALPHIQMAVRALFGR